MRKPIDCVTALVGVLVLAGAAHAQAPDAPPRVAVAWDGAQLFKALADRDIVTVEELLDADPDLIHALDREWATPLHAAAASRRADLVECLLDRGADPHAFDMEGRTPLERASPVGLDIQQLLIAHGAEHDVFSAAAAGDMAALRTLIEDWPELVNSERAFLTPLCSAARWGRLDAVRLLLDSGARTTPTRERVPPTVHWAVVGGHVDVVRMLLAHEGGDGSGAAGVHGFLRTAAGLGHTAVVELLLEHGADPNVAGVRGSASSLPLPLTAAACRGYADIVSLLLAKGALIDGPPGVLQTPLQWAAQMSMPSASAIGRRWQRQPGAGTPMQRKPLWPRGPRIQ